MKKVLLLSFAFGLIITMMAAPRPALATGFGDSDPLAPPPSAEEILDEALGEETPILPGQATDDTTQVVKVTEETPFLGWGAMLIYENSLGLGTFVQGEQQRAQWDMLLGVRANLYLFQKYLRVQAGISMTQPIVENSDSGNTKANQFLIGDFSLGFSIPNLYTEPVTGIRFGASMGFGFPTSLASQHANRYLNWRTGVFVSKSFGPVRLLYQFGFTKNFHGSKSPKLDYEYLPDIARYPAIGVSTNFSFSNRLGVSVSFLEDFYASLDFSIFNSFKYDTEDDITCADVGLAEGCDLHSPYADPGSGRSDLTSMSLEVGWSPLRYLTVALGVATYQPPKTSDNSSFRFPLNFTDASANFTTFYLDIVGSY